MVMLPISGHSSLVSTTDLDRLIIVLRAVCCNMFVSYSSISFLMFPSLWYIPLMNYGCVISLAFLSVFLSLLIVLMLLPPEGSFSGVFS